MVLAGRMSHVQMPISESEPMRLGKVVGSIAACQRIEQPRVLMSRSAHSAPITSFGQWFFSQSGKTIYMCAVAQTQERIRRNRR